MSRRKLENARVVLTGASSGIGRALALELGRLGCRMVLVSRREDKLQALAEVIRSFPAQRQYSDAAKSSPVSSRGTDALVNASSGNASSGNASSGNTGVDIVSERIQIIAGDIVQDETRTAAIESAVMHFGGIDVLINNAGVGAFGLFEKADPERLLQILDVNLLSVIEMTRLALPFLIQSATELKASPNSSSSDKGASAVSGKVGSKSSPTSSECKTSSGSSVGHAWGPSGCVPIIVNTSSIMGKRGAPYSTEYSTAKFGVQGFSEALRAELVHRNIDVLVVSPGTTKTDFFDSVIETTGTPKWPSHKPATPEYVARRITAAMKKGTHQIVPYFWGEVLCVLNRISPNLVDWIMSRYV